jgi:hypothetical protein
VLESEALSKLDGLQNLTSATEITIGGNAVLSTLGGLANLTEVGTLTLVGLPALTNFVGLDKLGRAGALHLNNLDAVEDIVGLENLREVGTLGISELKALTSLSGFSQLEAVEVLLFWELMELPSLSGFEQLATMENVSLDHLPALADLSGLSGLREVTNALSVRGLTLGSLDGLQNLTRVGGTLAIWSNEKLETLDGVGEVEQVGALDVWGNPALRSLSGLTHLAQIGPAAALSDYQQTGLHVTACEALEEVGLHALHQVDGDFELARLSLEDLSGLESLTTVAGRFVIRELPQLESVDGLDNLVSAASMRLHYCDKLIDLRGLASLQSVASGCDLFMAPNLARCEVQWLEELLQPFGVYVTASQIDESSVCR